VRVVRSSVLGKALMILEGGEVRDFVVFAAIGSPRLDI